jgi:hypothetical protein
MSYSLYDKNQAAAAMVKAFPGMNLHTAVVWVTAEQGDNHNILGVTYYDKLHRQRLYKYGTFEEGAAAAAKIIFADPQYANVVASLKRNDIHDQLYAIARCPWHLGANGLKKAGGVDPYYLRIFKEMGYDVAK